MAGIGSYQALIMSHFGGVYHGKRVLVTGYTGFKGSWLATWLVRLGANVCGIANGVPTQPAMCEMIRLPERVTCIEGDVRDGPALRRVVDDMQPDFVFHLAAQAIVSTSYRAPVDTISTNVLGTANVLDALRACRRPCAAVVITSDKAYENVEWPWGYRETDALGGKDIYSASKGAAELIVRGYVHSFFAAGHPVRVAPARAGNVIGGGDWAKDRIVVDCIRAWTTGRPVEIRRPSATRPWQHVLEPLSGYLQLGAMLAQAERFHGEAYNFGPKAEQNRTVLELLTDLARAWGFQDMAEAYTVNADPTFHEAGLLKLNCDKALLHLKWEPNLDYAETIGFVAQWYKTAAQGGDVYETTVAQIHAYEDLARIRHRAWTQMERTS